MNDIKIEAEKVLGKWDKREWRRYLLRTAFGFKNGNSKLSQEIVNRFLMLIDYIKSLKIDLKEIKNYFKEFSYKGVIKQAIKKLDSKKVTKKRRQKRKLNLKPKQKLQRKLLKNRQTRVLRKPNELLRS